MSLARQNKGTIRGFVKDHGNVSL